MIDHILASVMPLRVGWICQLFARTGSKLSCFAIILHFRWSLSLIDRKSNEILAKTRFFGLHLKLKQKYYQFVSPWTPQNHSCLTFG